MRTLLATAAAAVGLLVVALPGSAAAADRNHDGIPDRWEKRHGLSLKVNQAKRDQDSDQLNNRGEHRFGLDPRDDDSDDDGVEDGDESSGVISAFDTETGALTIDPINGDPITALVNEDTEVECDNGDDHGDEDGDNSGPGHGDDDEDEDHGGPGHDGDDDEDDEEEDCSADDLVVGALVQEAELEIEDGFAVWEEIELLV